MFCLKLFQLAISLLFSNFILLIVQTANSKYGSCWKLLMEMYQWINMIIMVVQFPRVTFCFAWKLFQLAISLLFSNFILLIVQTANSKYKVGESYQHKCINGWHDNNGHPIFKSNILICMKLFQLAISLVYSNFICPQLFILFIVQTANSKYGSWWKLLMEVYQWINMIIMVVQFPRVTFCFAWKLFQLAISLLFSNFINYCTNCKFKVRKLVKAINGSVSMD